LQTEGGYFFVAAITATNNIIIASTIESNSKSLIAIIPFLRIRGQSSPAKGLTAYGKDPDKNYVTPYNTFSSKLVKTFISQCQERCMPGNKSQHRKEPLGRYSH